MKISVLFIFVFLLPLQAVCGMFEDSALKYQRENYEIFANQFDSIDNASPYLIFTFGKTKKSVMFVFKRPDNYKICICTDNNGGEIYKEIFVTESPLLDWTFTQMSEAFNSMKYTKQISSISDYIPPAICVYTWDGELSVLIPIAVEYTKDSKASKEFAKNITKLHNYLFKYWREVYDWYSMFR